MDALYEHYNAANEYISDAESEEENRGDRYAVLSLYGKAIDELINGLGVKLDGKDAEINEGLKAQEFMQTELEKILERVDNLNSQFSRNGPYRLSKSHEQLSNLKLPRINDRKPHSSKTSPQRKANQETQFKQDANNHQQSIFRDEEELFEEKNEEKKRSEDLISKLAAKMLNLGDEATAVSRCNPQPAQPQQSTALPKSKYATSENRSRERVHSSRANTSQKNNIPMRYKYVNPKALGKRAAYVKPKVVGSSLGLDKESILKNIKIPNVEKDLIANILDEILEHGPNIRFSDIAGQEKAKEALQELVILPSLNPALFTGLLAPIKGLLLFGPPGNGKTMLAKAVANESKRVFINITAASLFQKLVGEGEKTVRCLFAVANYLQPSIIFLDEIDSVLRDRENTNSSNPVNRKIITEFLTQFDGIQSSSEDKVLVMGATNRPQDLDEAALRRFPKRICVDLPDFDTRKSLLIKLLDTQGNSLTPVQVTDLALRTDGYSGSDLTALAKDAAIQRIRERPAEEIKKMKLADLRPMSLADFEHSLLRIRPATTRESLAELYEWNKKFAWI